MIVEGFGGCLPAECLAGARVESGSDRGEVLGTPAGKVGAFREVLAQQSIGVLVRATLPRGMRVGEVDGQPGLDGELGVRGQFLAAVPGQRPTQLLRKLGDGLGEGTCHRDRAVAGQRRAVLRARDDAPAFFTGQVNEHREPSRALDQSADRRALESDDEVAFPMPGHVAVIGFGRALADQDLRGDVRPCLLP
jgi:hypothetical protein